jgi:hypothetical protein
MTPGILTSSFHSPEFDALSNYSWPKVILRSFAYGWLNCYYGKFSEETLLFMSEALFKGIFSEGRKFEGSLRFANSGYLLESE